MKGFAFRGIAKFGLSLAVIAAAVVGSTPVLAQKPLEPDQKSDEKSKIARVEVTPATGMTAIGSKMQFKAVAKDASGQTLPDAVKYLYAAPFDAAGADQNGEMSFFQPGEVTVGA